MLFQGSQHCARRTRSPMRPLPERRESFRRSPFAEHADLRFVALDAGHATVVLPAHPDVLEESGAIHRGAISALVEAAGEAAWWTDDSADDGEVPAVDLFVSFVRPVPEQPLTAEAHVVGREARRSVCDVDVRDWNGELVAKAVVTYRL
jgi:uncharacterized protein (TIGR00369 family)